jgi:hypothetical protein
MSLISGAIGSKTILLDGVQVDAISENTVNNGVQIQGRTSGTVIGSGYIGQRFDLTYRQMTMGTYGANYAVSSSMGTIPAGIWIIFPLLFVSSVPNLLVTNAFLSSNSNADASGNPTGIIWAAQDQVSCATNGNTNANITISLGPKYLASSVSTDVYWKAWTIGASSVIGGMSAYAIRIG